MRRLKLLTGLKPAKLSGNHWVYLVGSLSLLKVKTLDHSLGSEFLLLFSPFQWKIRIGQLQAILHQDTPSPTPPPLPTPTMLRRPLTTTPMQPTPTTRPLTLPHAPPSSVVSWPPWSPSSLSWAPSSSSSGSSSALASRTSASPPPPSPPSTSPPPSSLANGTSALTSETLTRRLASHTTASNPLLPTNRPRCPKPPSRPSIRAPRMRLPWEQLSQLSELM